MSSTQFNPGCGVNIGVHVYKENKLKMAKHPGCLTRYLQASATDLSRKQSEIPYNVDRFRLDHGANGGFHKRRKVEDSNQCIISDTSCPQLQCFQSPVMIDQPRYFPHKQSYNFSTSSTTNANMSHISCIYSTQNSGNASESVSSKNISKFTTSQGDYAIVVGEILNSANESYEVLSFLGRGTFGQVVKCRSQSSKRCVAIKILKNLPSYLRQGNVEIQILQTLSKEDTESHNIVRAIECFQHKCHMCFVFELLEQNLYEYLKSNKFRPLVLTEIRPIAQQVLTALSKLKSLGLIHADLKPENIMLASSTSGPMRYRVKVIDFGSACHSSKAVQNTYLQSRYYRAPEILLGLPFNEAIDMWSLGCVVAELFLGWPLYPGSSEYDQMRYIVETQGLPPSDLLQNAAKTATFFVCDPYRCEWRMKTQEEYTAETGQQAKEARKYFFSSLAQICDVAGILPPDSPEHNCEVEDRQQFANLLMLMLIIRPSERVVPDTALQHPFITMSHLQRHPFSKRFHESMIVMQICHESVRRQHLSNVRSNNLNMKNHQEVQRYNSLTSLSCQSLDTQCVMKNEPLSSSHILYSPLQIANNTPTSLLMNACPPSTYHKTSIISPSLYCQPQVPANPADTTAAYYAAAAAAAAAAATALTSSRSSGKNSTVTIGLSGGATIRAAPEVKYLRPQRYPSQTRVSGQQRSNNAHHMLQEEEHSLRLSQRHQLIPPITFLPQSSEPPLLPIACSSETRSSTATAAAAAAAAAATVLLAQTNADAYILRQQQLPLQQHQEPVVLVHNHSPSQSTLYGLAIAANGAENALSLLNAAAAAAVTRASNTAPMEFVCPSQGGFHLSSVNSGHLQKPQTAAVQQIADHCHQRHIQQEAYLSAMDAERAALVLSSYLTKERGSDGSGATVYNISRHHYSQQEPSSTVAYPIMSPPSECQTAVLPNVLQISTASTVGLQETLNAFVQHQQNRKHQEQHYNQQEHDLYRNPTAAAAAAAAVAALGGFSHQSQQHCQGLLTNRAMQLQDNNATKCAVDHSTLTYAPSRLKPHTLHQSLVTPHIRSEQNLQHHQRQMCQTFRVPHSITDTSEILRIPHCYTRGQENRLSASFNCGKPHDLRLTMLTTTSPGRASLNCNAMANSTASLYRSHPVLPTTPLHQDSDQQPRDQISSQTPHLTIFSSTPITRSCTPTCQCPFNATPSDSLLDNSDNMSKGNSGDIVPINLATSNAQQCTVETKASHTRQSQPVQHHPSASHSLEDVMPQNPLLEYEKLLQARASLQETLPEYVHASHENSASDKVSMTKVEHSFATASHNDAMFADCRPTVVQPQTSLQQNPIVEKKIPVGRVQPMVKQEECFASPPRLQVSSPPPPAAQRRILRYSGVHQAVDTLSPLYPMKINTNRLSDGQQQQLNGVQHRHLPVIAAQRQQDAQNSSTARNLSAAHAAAAAYHNIMFFQLQQQQQQQQQQRAMQPTAHHYQNQLQQILSSETIPSSGLCYADQPLLFNQSDGSAPTANWMSLASTSSSSGVYAQQDRHQQQQMHRNQQQPLADSATAAAAASYYAAAAAAAAVAQHRGRQELDHKLLLLDNQDQQQKLRLLTGHHPSDYCAQ